MNEWFAQEGNDSDVVIASRARIARNVSGYAYPGSMSSEEEVALRDRIRQSFEDIPGETYRMVSLSELTPLNRRILLEKKFISQDFCLNKDKNVVLNKYGNFSAMINGKDHLRLNRLEGGLALGRVLDHLMELDRQLEYTIEFNASFDLGYLGPDLKNLGTAMKMSVMLHLPSLEATGLIDKALKTILQSGMRVAGFSGENDQSLGQFYIMENRDSLGVSEEEIRDNLEKITNQLITYEQMAREDLMKRKMIELEDRVYRGVGLLEKCRLLSRNEGLELIAALRLGRVLKLNEYEIEKLNGLIVLGQDSHIKKRLLDRGEETDEISVDRERADFFRKILGSEDAQGGTSYV